MDCDTRLVRLWRYVGPETATGCLPWQGFIKPNGYGMYAGEYIHREMYRLMVGPIPEGLTIDHLCKNRSCGYVGHMELVTRGENSKRGFASQTQCRHGHPYTEQTTYTYTLRYGNGKVTTGRKCRVCDSQRRRDWQPKRSKVKGVSDAYEHMLLSKEDPQ